MADGGLCLGDVQKFIADNGGKVSNHALIKHFKSYFNDTENQTEARAKFKDIVNAVATIKQENGVKYLVLKKQLTVKRKKHSGSTSSSSGESNVFHQLPVRHNLSEDDSQPMDVSADPTSPESISSSMEREMNMPLQAVTMLQPNSSSGKGPWSTDLPPGHIPQPPPRRKNSARSKENRGAKFEEDMKQLSEEKESQESPRQEEIKEIVSPGSVKEKAQMLNRMASEVDLSQKGLANGATHGGSGRRRDRHDKNHDDDDTCSVSTLDPRRKEWILKSSQAEYHTLAKLLRDEPKLVHCKGLNSYTALHWAAKHGKLDVIKLVAGTYKANTNARTSGGYTPLHLAAMFGREEIMEILINTYGADASIRDYSGKRAIQYLPRVQAQRFSTIFPDIVANGKYNSSRPDKEVGLHRIGSLNSKVKKTSAMFCSNKALTRMKSWGSADNIQDKNLMPPPKFFPKRKKSRKHGDYFGSLDSGKGRSGDSDSDSAPGLSNVQLS